MTVSNEHRLVGAGFGIVSAVIPDALIDPLQKLVIAALVALLSGFCYAAGGWLWSRLKK